MEKLIIDQAKLIAQYIDELRVYYNIDTKHYIKIIKITELIDSKYKILFNVFPSIYLRDHLSSNFILFKKYLKKLLSHNVNISNIDIMMDEHNINIELSFHSNENVSPNHIYIANNIRRKLDFFMSKNKHLNIQSYIVDVFELENIVKYKYNVDLLFDKNITDEEEEEIFEKIYPETKKYINDNYKNILGPYNNKMTNFAYNIEDYYDKIIITFSVAYKKLKRPNDYNMINNELKSKFGGLTSEQIMASPFIAIQHVTYMKSFENILKYGKFENRLSLSKKKIEVHKGVTSAYAHKKFSIEESAHNSIQFPGFFTEIKTQNNFFNYITPSFVYGKEITVLLSLSLLKQKNWHFNVFDNYGIINNNTFSAESLSKYISMLPILWKTYYDEYELSISNELIFHDDISIDFIEMIIVENIDMKNKVDNILKEYKLNIPVKIRSSALHASLIYDQFTRYLYTNEHLNYYNPQFCYTNASGYKHLDPEYILQHMFDKQKPYTMDLDPEYILQHMFDKRNPYTMEIMDISKEDLNNENIYIWNKMLENCNIRIKFNNFNKSFSLIQDRLQQLYFEDVGKTYVKKGNYPPFKYTPEYYSKYI